MPVGSTHEQYDAHPLRVRSQTHVPAAVGRPAQSHPATHAASDGSAVVVVVVVVAQSQLCVVVVVLLVVVVQFTRGAAMPSTHDVRVHEPDSQPHQVG